MNVFRIATRSAAHFWRMNFAIALGVAAAVAVLVGALVIGDSMRGSLRDITLDRLANVDELLTSDHFFREALAAELLADESLGKDFSAAVPAIVLPATTVEFRSGGQVRRSVDVTLYAVPDAIWEMDSNPAAAIQSNEAIINQQLAAELGIGAMTDGSAERPTITIRITTQQQLSSDSALGKKDGLVQSLPDVGLAQVIPNHGLGRFGMSPTQLIPHNVFVSLSWFQDQLGSELFKGKSDFRQANLIFLRRRSQSAPMELIAPDWQTRLQPKLEDLGLRLTHVVRRFQSAVATEPQVAWEYFSLTSDGLVFSAAEEAVIATAFPDAQPIFTYLANRMQVVRDGQPIGEAIPFSMVSGWDWPPAESLESAVTGKSIAPLGPGEIVLNEWAVLDLGLQTEGSAIDLVFDIFNIEDDIIRLSYFQPEAVGGEEVEKYVDLKMTDIAELTEPVEPFRRRGGELLSAEFSQPPTWANDPDLTPLVPGLTDAESIEAWSLPFETPGIRRADDDYWRFYRTTPKAFVSLATAQSLWTSRFGKVTSFRLRPSATEDELRGKLESVLQGSSSTFGLNLVSLRANGLRASKGSTPFDLLFLALSMFVMASALILVALLIRLAIQQRSNQLGILSAVGFAFPKIMGVWLAEMIWVCGLGAMLGAGIGVGYAQWMLWGLRTWWVGAIRTPFIRLHVSPTTLALGTTAGLSIGLLAIAWTLWRVRRNSVVRLLAGQIDSPPIATRRGARWPAIVGWVLAAGAIVSLITATGQGGEAQAGLFFAGGFCSLAALLIGVRSRLTPRASQPGKKLRLASLAALNARRNPLRSLLTIGLVGVATFLIAAVSAFRITPNQSGTGGFDYVATSNQPLFADLNTAEGRTSILLEANKFPNETTVLSFRTKSGDDASCTNPYQVAQPRVIGVPPSAIALLDSPSATPFSWSGVLDGDRTHPWQLLAGREAAEPNEPIPAVLDKNTAWYSLKIFGLGSTFDVHYDSGERVTFRLVGLLNNTILQGSILVSERDFTRAFPGEVGYRYFLIKAAPEDRLAVLGQLENDLADQGFDGRDANELLAELLAVQNTYLSTFQALGALGLLLGTFGLGAVQLRNVLERQRELALLRAVGYYEGKLVRLVFLESFFLLVVGLGVGLVAATVVVLPHFVFGNATIPWLQLGIVFAVILAIGWLTVWWSSRRVVSLPLIAALRGE